MKRYRVQVDQYVTNCNIDSKCNYIKFTNIGPTAFKLNNVTLNSREFLEIFGNEDETDVTVYMLDVGVDTDCVCQVIRKYYL